MVLLLSPVAGAFSSCRCCCCRCCLVWLTLPSSAVGTVPQMLLPFLLLMPPLYCCYSLPLRLLVMLQPSRLLLLQSSRGRYWCHLLKLLPSSGCCYLTVGTSTLLILVLVLPSSWCWCTVLADATQLMLLPSCWYYAPESVAGAAIHLLLVPTSTC